MDSFEIHWRSSTRKDLRRIPPQDVARLIDAVRQLSTQPYGEGATKLAGVERTYRIRIGDYRIVYEVDSRLKRVEVLRVRHRRDVYRN